MATNSKGGMTIETTERQTAYVKEQKKKGKGLGLVFADAFLRGMRDIGYKSPAWALAEMFDNAFQAAAQTVSIRFGFAEKNEGRGKPDFLAIADDGNGMIPEMISYAVRWGGTDRENDRAGFGRYGYGLPSSAVSMAKRYTVYSKIAAGGWNAVTVDLEELADAAGDLKRTEELLSPNVATLPSWLIECEDRMDLKGLKSGTVIVLEDLDQLRTLSGWIKTDTLKAKLLQHFGVIYRHWIPERRVCVEGTDVLAVDPLFLMEHARFYDETPVHAEVAEGRTIEVETKRGTKGQITIRASLLPPNFSLLDPNDYRPDMRGVKHNKRFDILKAYNGLVICREKRQIDTVAPRFTKFQNEDMYIKIEIDFDPELDEYFGITTSKQQIEIDDDMWERLQHSGKNGGGLYDLVKDLRNRREELDGELRAKMRNRQGQEQPRPSVTAMEASEKFKDAVPPPTPEQQREAIQNLEHAATEIANKVGKQKEEVLLGLIEKGSKHKWDIEFTATPEGPFYRPIRFGEQKRLVINTDHPFYTKLYEPSPGDVRHALEILLFVVAERELESRGEAEIFYKAERQKWSERLRHALDELVADEAMANKAAVVAEQMHMAADADEVTAQR